MSYKKCRIESFQFDACVISCELPVDLGFQKVSVVLPRGDFPAHHRHGFNAPVEALPNHDIDLHFRDIEPAVVLRGIDELEAVSQGLGMLRWIGS